MSAGVFVAVRYGGDTVHTTVTAAGGEVNAKWCPLQTPAMSVESQSLLVWKRRAKPHKSNLLMRIVQRVWCTWVVTRCDHAKRYLWWCVA